MGNSLGGRKKRAVKVMKVDGTTFKLKPPARAADALRDHPGHAVLESEEVKLLGLRAQPLGPEQLLQPGKIYFVVELPKLPPDPAPASLARRAWSGSLHVSAKDRLESLMLSRRTVSDLAHVRPLAEATGDGGVRFRMRLPKAELARVVEESKDSAEAAERIMQLCAQREEAAAAAQRVPPALGGPARRKEKRTRFMPMPEEMVA